MGVAADGTFHHIWLWEAEGLVLTDTRAPQVEHRHAAVQVVVCLRGRGAMRVAGQRWRHAAGTVVATDVPHAYDSLGEPTLGLWVDPRSRAGRALRRRHLTDDRRLAVLDPRTVDTLRALVPEPPTELLPATAARELFTGLLATMVDPAPESSVPDPRVRAVLERLEGRLRLPPVRDLAETVGLSASRLQHLVRDDLGMSLSRWLLWRRTLRGLDRMLDGATATDAALAVGFADVADFTRRFQEFLGASPVAAMADPRARIVVASRLAPGRSGSELPGGAGGLDVRA